MNQYVIRSNERGLYFVAIHSFTPFYGDKAKARRFSSHEMATAWARTELFTSDAAFTVESVPEEK
jgi:hypothetical protein